MLSPRDLMPFLQNAMMKGVVSPFCIVCFGLYSSMYTLCVFFNNRKMYRICCGMSLVFILYFCIVCFILLTFSGSLLLIYVKDI